MMRPAALLPALALALLLGGCGAPPPVPGGRLGSLRVFAPQGDPRSIVVWLGAARGWSPADEAAARRLTSAGAIVAGVDLPVYLAALEKEHGRCLYLVGDVEHAARRVERRFGLDRYLSPVLAGAGMGGRLALAMMEQAPSATLAGVATVDPAAKLETATPICRQPPSDAGMAAQVGGESVVIGYSPQATADEQHARRMAALSLAGLQPVIEQVPPAATPEGALAELILRQFAKDRWNGSDSQGSLDLPLVTLPSSPGAPLAIVLSGDGGWRDIDKEIAAALHRRGYAVIGWDCLRYFWQARTADILARDMARLLSFYQARWQPQGVVLIGYSFGADVLPFAFNRLPAELRQRIVQISLLGYAGRADFEIRVAGWFGAGPSDAALDGGPELARIEPRLIQCFYGAEEGDSACPRLRGRGVEVIETGGGHYFDGGYLALARRIAEGVTARSRQADISATQ
jgi:type IV secretory pathway VirJ component